MLSHYYDPYRSVPEMNKGIYYNYPQTPNFNGLHTNQEVGQIPQHQTNKWTSQYTVNNANHTILAPNSYLERNSSQESYYSNISMVLPKLNPSVTPSPRKMLTSSFAENVITHVGKGKSRSPQRIYKTHSDLNKEKSKKSNKKVENDEIMLNKSGLEKAENTLKKEIEALSRKESNRKDHHDHHHHLGSADILNQILKKTQNTETHVMVVNHKLMMMENKFEQILTNQKNILSKVEHIEKDMKNGSGMSPELLKEIKDALNIDFDIDLEIKPDEKINKYSINSIKAYKSLGDN